MTDSRSNIEQQLSVQASKFVLLRESHTLITMQNIRSELEEREMQAWQNLIRVLTHEIMNSITPVSSLASTAAKILQNSNPSNIQADQLGDIAIAVQTIEKRSKGLLDFVQKYRQLTQVPKPSFQPIHIIDIIKRIENLLQPQMANKAIAFEVDVHPQRLKINADPALIEQALLNLIKNAIEALNGQESAKITVRAQLDSKARPIIAVSDNGPGISPTAIEKIFIPFFTTKKTGSGIGLSLARQIMRLHHGDIVVRSKETQGTTFTLGFELK
jgi:signal transduction histidine kinase